MKEKIKKYMWIGVGIFTIIGIIVFCYNYRLIDSAVYYYYGEEVDSKGITRLDNADELQTSVSFDGINVEVLDCIYDKVAGEGICFMRISSDDRIKIRGIFPTIETDKNWYDLEIDDGEAFLQWESRKYMGDTYVYMTIKGVKEEITNPIIKIVYHNGEAELKINNMYNFESKYIENDGIKVIISQFGITMKNYRVKNPSGTASTMKNYGDKIGAKEAGGVTDFYINMKNGEKIDFIGDDSFAEENALDHCYGYSNFNDEKVQRCYMIFKHIIDVNDITSVVINGETIEVN